jgi:biopolymer transport protein ExbD
MAASTDSGTEDGTISGINVTPFVDVALVLLIIFMVTAKYIVSPQSIPVDLPRAATSQQQVVTSTVQISITARGDLSVESRHVSEAELRTIMQQRRQANPEVRAVIAADRAVPHGRVVQVIDIVRSAGVSRFAIQTELPTSVEPGR